MFYNTKEKDHNLLYNPFKSCIVPRPIGWISTISNDGIVNIAPFSYFNAVSDLPPVIMFSSSQKPDGDEKDTIKNIEQNGEFVFNIATYDLQEAMSQSSTPLPYGVSEAEEYDIQTTPSELVKPPRIALSPINLECRHIKTMMLDADGVDCKVKVIFGHVIGCNINDNVITDGKIDLKKIRPIARLGYDQYAVIDNIFTLKKKK
jgi:flavin reductase (DIM6/NTAB) family NADH-FMN oxidoreductase RutF